MQTVKLTKCPDCGARINPSWETCISCEYPLLDSCDDKSDLSSILHMPLSKFKKACLLARVRCGHFNGEDIFIASTEKEAEVGRSEGLVVYLVDELIELVKGKPISDVMRQIHYCKKILEGTLLETKKRKK